jgi:hypothetical protein
LNIDEIGELLGRVAYSDNRTVDAGLIMHWEEMLPADLTFQECMDALRHHRQTSTAYLNETHIIQRVAEVRKSAGRDRLARAGDAPYPPNLSQAQERAWKRAWMDSIKSGAFEPVREADAVLGYARPKELQPDPVKVRAIENLAKSKAIPGRRVS